MNRTLMRLLLSLGGRGFGRKNAEFLTQRGLEFEALRIGHWRRTRPQERDEAYAEKRSGLNLPDCTRGSSPRCVAGAYESVQ